MHRDTSSSTVFNLQRQLHSIPVGWFWRYLFFKDSLYALCACIGELHLKCYQLKSNTTLYGKHYLYKHVQVNAFKLLHNAKTQISFFFQHIFINRKILIKIQNKSIFKCSWYIYIEVHCTYMNVCIHDQMIFNSINYITSRSAVIN